VPPWTRDTPGLPAPSPHPSEGSPLGHPQEPPPQSLPHCFQHHWAPPPSPLPPAPVPQPSPRLGAPVWGRPPQRQVLGGGLLRELRAEGLLSLALPTGFSRHRASQGPGTGASGGGGAASANRSSRGQSSHGFRDQSDRRGCASACTRRPVCQHLPRAQRRPRGAYPAAALQVHPQGQGQHSNRWPQRQPSSAWPPVPAWLAHAQPGFPIPLDSWRLPRLLAGWVLGAEDCGASGVRVESQELDTWRGSRWGR